MNFHTAFSEEGWNLGEGEGKEDPEI